MTDESTNAPGETSAVAIAGERLAKARREREIPIHDIAKALHLDEPKVRALEQNEFASLGAPVFAKGYLRKYAELVGVPVDEVLSDYQRFDRSPPVLPIVSRRPKPPREISPGPWLAGLLVLALLAGGAWFWRSGGVDRLLAGRTLPVPTQPAAEERAPRRDVPAPPASTAPEVEPGIEPPSPAAGELPPAGPETVSPAADAAGQPAPEQVPAESAAVASGEVELGLSFSGDCWTEVSDADGEQLFFGLGTEGRTVSVSGKAPLHVLLGDSQYAAVTVDGSEFPIPASARRGQTARLTITRQ
jgi:cytoskeleton protein RodZ